MKLTLTRAQLLKQWRLRAFPEPANSGQSVTAISGIDLDAFLEAAMLDWYHNLLLTAPPELLNPVDLAESISVYTTAWGAVAMPLPENTVRLLEIKLEGWSKAATIVTDPLSPLALRQLSCFTRSSADEPVAILAPGASTALLYPAVPTPQLAAASVVVDTLETFNLDSAAFNTIQPITI
ncbi:MAG: hypothetical protein NC343_03515 [Muribaculum sp.]|nr:hypothetical protein [Muribaculaceae bacterium]MCM1080796.1 hypothetical protein [Muribaculum sp.]